MTQANGVPIQISDVLEALDSFEEVPVSNDRVGRTPEESVVDVERSGRSQFNTTATRQFVEMVIAAGLKPGQVLLKFSVGKGGFVCGVPVPNTVVGAAKVTTHGNDRISFQLHEVFKKYPDLRPVVRQRCTPVFTKKADGTPCMVIGLKTGQDNPVVPRKNSK